MEEALCLIILGRPPTSVHRVGQLACTTKRRLGWYGGLDFSSSISSSLPLLCGLCSGQSWGAFELLVPPSISCLKLLELLVCAERACDLSLGGSDRGLLSRSTYSSERWY
ncbi:hypothetical protein ACOSQ4_009212 [Xanthoceras sorbifolium]